MGSLNDLIVKVGVDGIPAFKSAFKDAIEALETTNDRAAKVGASLSRAFSSLGISDSSTQVAAQAKKIQASFEQLDAAFKKGAITPKEYEKAVEGLRAKLAALGDTTEPLVAKIQRINDTFSRIGLKNTDFQITEQVKALKSDLQSLEEEFKQGAISEKDFAAATKQVAAELEKLTKVPVKSFADNMKDLGAISDNLKRVGTTLTASITAPLLGVAGASVKMAGDFEAAMNKVEAIGDITGQSLKDLEAQAIDLGAKTKFSATEAAEGMAELAAAGLKASQVMETIPSVLSLAAVGQISVGEAARGAADLMGQFGLRADELGKAIDVVAKGASASSASVAQFVESFKTVGSVAHAAGLGIADVSSALTLLAQGGRKAEQAGTDLRSVLGTLLDPSKEAAAAMASLQISVKDAQGNLKPFTEVMGELNKLAGHTAETFKIFGKEGATGATIFARAGKQAFSSLRTEINNTNNDANRIAETMNKGIRGAFEKAKGSIESLGVSIGKALEPVAVSLAGGLENTANLIANIVEKFKALPAPVQIAAGAVTAFFAAFPVALLAGGYIAGTIVDIAKGFQLLKEAGGVSGAIQNLSEGFRGMGVSVANLAPLIVKVGGALGALYIANELKEPFLDLASTSKVLFESFFGLEERGNKAADTIRGIGQSSKASIEEVSLMSVAMREMSEVITRIVPKTDSWETFWQNWLTPIGFAKQAMKNFAEDFRTWTQLIGGDKATQKLYNGDVVTPAVSKQVEFTKANMRRQGEEALRIAQAQSANFKAQQAAAPPPPAQGAVAIKATVAALQAEYDTAVKTRNELKRLGGTKEELALATDKVNDAYKKLHPNLDGTSARVDKLAQAMNRLGVKNDSTDIKQWTNDLAVVEAAFRKGIVGADDWARAQEAAFLKVNKLILDSDAELNRIRGQQNFQQLRNLYSVDWFENVKLGIKAQADARKAFEAFDATSTGKFNTSFAREALSDIAKLGEAIDRVRGKNGGLTESADKAYDAYRRIQDAVDGITDNLINATQYEADLLKLDALGKTIAAIRQEEPVNPFNTRALQEAQELIKQVKSDLASIRIPEDAYAELGLKSIKDLQIEVERTAKAYDILRESGTASAGDIAFAQRKLLEDQIQLAKAAGLPWADLEVRLRQVNAEMERIAKYKGFDNLRASVALFAQDFDSAFRKLADESGDALVDAMFGEKKIGPALTKLWKSFTDSMKDALKDALQTAFIDPITNGLKEAMGNIVSGFLKNLSGGITKTLGQSLGGAFGAGGALTGLLGGAGGGVNAVANATRGAQNVAAAQLGLPSGILGSGAKASGGAASSIGGLASGLNIATGIASAISSVIGNFQMARLEDTMNQIERNTAQLSINLVQLIDEVQKWLPRLGDIKEVWYVYIDAFRSLMGTVESIQARIENMTDAFGESQRSLAEAVAALPDGTREFAEVILSGLNELSLDITGAIRDAVSSLTTAIKGIGSIGSEIGSGSSLEANQRLRELQFQKQDTLDRQNALLERLPADLASAIRAGNIASPSNAEESSIIRTYNELHDLLMTIEHDINSLKGQTVYTTKPATSTVQSTTSSGAVNPETVSFDPSKVQTRVEAVRTDSGIPAFLGAIADLTERMSGYWERLFEVLASGTGLLTGAVDGTGKDLQSSLKLQGALTEKGTGSVVSNIQTGAANTVQAVYGVTDSLEGVSSKLAEVGTSVRMSVEDISTGINDLVATSQEAVAALPTTSGRMSVEEQSQVVANAIESVTTSGSRTGGFGSPPSLVTPQDWGTGWQPIQYNYPSMTQPPSAPRGPDRPTRRETARTPFEVIIKPLPLNVSGRRLGDILFESTVRETGLYI